MYEGHVRGKVQIPVKVEGVLYYEVPVREAHGVSREEMKDEAEDMVTNYLDRLTDSRRIKTATMMEVTASMSKVRLR